MLVPSLKRGSDEQENTFMLSHIPGVKPFELSGGKVLHQGRHRIAKLLDKRTDHVSSIKSAQILWKTLRSVGYNRGETLKRIAQLCWFLWQSKAPHDREYFRESNPSVQAFTEEIVGNFVTPDSTVHGAENIKAAVERTANGEGLVAFCNHSNEIDPVILRILLQRSADEEWQQKDDTVAQAMHDMRDKLTAVAGHRVMLDRFRRAFTGDMHTVFTLASKHTQTLSKETRKYTAPYNRNVIRVIRALLTNPNYMPLIFYEGGRTRNNTIIMQRQSATFAKSNLVLPLHLDERNDNSLTDLLRVEHGPDMDTRPRTCDLYVGETIDVDAPGIHGTEKVLEAMLCSLKNVGAPIEKHTWMAEKKGS